MDNSKSYFKKYFLFLLLVVISMSQLLFWKKRQINENVYQTIYGRAKLYFVLYSNYNYIGLAIWFYKINSCLIITAIYLSFWLSSNNFTLAVKKNKLSDGICAEFLNSKYYIWSKSFNEYRLYRIIKIDLKLMINTRR